MQGKKLISFNVPVCTAGILIKKGVVCQTKRSFFLTAKPAKKRRLCRCSLPALDLRGKEAQVANSMLQAGIVGLPNVGKSTLFNALTRSRKAEAANYPFCTIEPNVGVVEVPDERLFELQKIAGTKVVIPAAIEFVDIAGLVAGASKGEGLGNKFLANIREVDAVVHVVRCFDNDDILHTMGKVDPIRDIGVIETELILADIQSAEQQLDKNQKKIKKTYVDQSI